MIEIKLNISGIIILFSNKLRIPEARVISVSEPIRAPDNICLKTVVSSTFKP